MPGKDRIRDWEKFYKEETIEDMPWYYPDLDPDVEKALEELGIRSGHFLDLGTGPGTQAIALARRGFRVTAIDFSRTAVEKAIALAKKERVGVEFRRDDILSSRLETEFDYILDRGCFHTFPHGKRIVYIKSVYARLKPGGILFLKCFSSRETGPGPFRFEPEEIVRYFSKVFRVLSIVETVYHGKREPHPIALFCICEKSTSTSQTP